MNKEDLVKLLVDVPSPISAIEGKIGMPPGTLQKAIKGKRNLPKSWAIKLKHWVETKQYLTVGRKAKKVETKPEIARKEKSEVVAEKEELVSAPKLSFQQQLLNKKLGIK